MKFQLLKGLTLVSILWGSFAFAAPQTRLCASNMDDLRVKIENHFSNFSSNYTNRFVGHWVGKICLGPFCENKDFYITRHQKFMLDGTAINICPQSDGSFFVYSTDKKKSGLFKLSPAVRNQAHLIEATGDWAEASGSLWINASDTAEAIIPTDMTNADL